MTEKTILQKRNNPFLKSVLTVRKDLVAWVLIAPALIGFIVFNWQPFLSSGILAFFKTQGFEIKEFVGLKNFKDVLSDSSLAKAMLNSCKYTFWSLLIGNYVENTLRAGNGRIFKRYFKLSSPSGKPMASGRTHNNPDNYGCNNLERLWSDNHFVSCRFAVGGLGALRGSGYRRRRIFQKIKTYNASAFKLACKSYGNYADTRCVPKL